MPVPILAVKITLKSHFLQVKETLTRIGTVQNKNGALILNQICHILYESGAYYIVHYREFQKDLVIRDVDIERRNYIISLLLQWEMISVDDPELFKTVCKPKGIAVVAFKNIGKYQLQPNHEFTSRLKVPA